MSLVHLFVQEVEIILRRGLCIIVSNSRLMLASFKCENNTGLHSTCLRLGKTSFIVRDRRHLSGSSRRNAIYRSMAADTLVAANVALWILGVTAMPAFEVEGIPWDLWSLRHCASLRKLWTQTPSTIQTIADGSDVSERPESKKPCRTSASVLRTLMLPLVSSAGVHSPILKLESTARCVSLQEGELPQVHK